MIRISKETDYGIVLLSCLAQAADASLSASALAERGRLPLPTVSKVLKLLARGGLYARLWAHQSGGFLGEDADEAETIPG